MKLLGIFGSSGLAREVSNIALEMGYEKIIFIDKTSGKEHITGFEIIKESEVLSISESDSISFVIGIGNGEIRRKIFSKFPNLNYVNIIHPDTTIGYKNQIVKRENIGNVFFPGARLTNNIQIGNFGLFNSNVTIGHDCIIEDFVTVSPGANVSGNVKLCEGCFIGTGSTILQGENLDKKLIIGENSIVGAGAVVVKNVESKIVVKGIPAK